MCGRVDVGVAALDVAAAARAAPSRRGRCRPRVPHRQPRADLVGEREQVELLAELAVVALGGLLETAAGRRAARPWSATRCRRCAAAAGSSRCRASRRRRRAVSAQPLPIMRVFGRCGPRQRSFQTVSPVAGRRCRRWSARRRRPRPTRPRLLLAAAALEPDELELERLVGELGARLVVGDDAADEPLALADDALASPCRSP